MAPIDKKHSLIYGFRTHGSLNVRNRKVSRSRFSNEKKLRHRLNNIFISKSALFSLNGPKLFTDVLKLTKRGSTGQSASQSVLDGLRIFDR